MVWLPSRIHEWHDFRGVNAHRSAAAARPKTQGGPFRLETSLFARGVWGKGVSKRKGPLEGIRLPSGNPMGPPGGMTGLRAAAGQRVAGGGARGPAGRSQREGAGPPEAAGRKARPSPKAA